MSQIHLAGQIDTVRESAQHRERRESVEHDNVDAALLPLSNCLAH